MDIDQLIPCFVLQHSVCVWYTLGKWAAAQNAIAAPIRCSLTIPFRLPLVPSMVLLQPLAKKTREFSMVWQWHRIFPFGQNHIRFPSWCSTIGTNCPECICSLFSPHSWALTSPTFSLQTNLFSLYLLRLRKKDLESHWKNMDSWHLYFSVSSSSFNVFHVIIYIEPSRPIEMKKGEFNFVFLHCHCIR